MELAICEWQCLPRLVDPRRRWRCVRLCCEAMARNEKLLKKAYGHYVQISTPEEMKHK